MDVFKTKTFDKKYQKLDTKEKEKVEKYILSFKKGEIRGKVLYKEILYEIKFKSEKRVYFAILRLKDRVILLDISFTKVEQQSLIDILKEVIFKL